MMPNGVALTMGDQSAEKRFRPLVKLIICASAAFVFGLASPSASMPLDQASIEFHGYLTLEYWQATANEGIDRPNASDPTNGAFDLHHVNFLIDVRILPELIAKFHIEFDHGADTELDAGDIILEYGFAELTLYNWLKIRAGKALTPFGYFNETHDSSPAFLSVLAPENIYQAHNRGGFSMIPKWNTGLFLLGDIFIGARHDDIDYMVYIGNGESLPSTNEAQYDDNTNKAVGGMIQFSTFDEAFQVALSGYYGDKAVTEDNLEAPHETLMISVKAAFGDFTAKGEFAISRLDEKNESAWYLQMSYRLGRYTPYLRYQSIDPDEDIKNDGWDTAIGGVKVEVNDHLFLKFEWDEHTRGENNSGILNEGNEDFGELRVAITLFF